LSLTAAGRKKNPNNNAFRCSLSSQKIYSLTRYIGGQKSTSSRVPIHVSTGVLPLAIKALLVTFMELFKITSLQLVEGKPGTWVAGQTSKKLIRVTVAEWLQLDVPKCLPHNLSHRWQWWESMGERDALSHIEELLTWGHLGKRRKPLLV
jgi:hypothetical protein